MTGRSKILEWSLRCVRNSASVTGAGSCRLRECGYSLAKNFRAVAGTHSLREEAPSEWEGAQGPRVSPEAPNQMVKVLLFLVR